MNEQLIRIMKKHAEAWEKVPEEKRAMYIVENDRHLSNTPEAASIRDLPPKLIAAANTE